MSAAKIRALIATSPTTMDCQDIIYTDDRTSEGADKINRAFDRLCARHTQAGALKTLVIYVQLRENEDLHKRFLGKI